MFLIVSHDPEVESDDSETLTDEVKHLLII